MKKNNLTRWTLFILLLAALSISGCQKLDNYSIDAPTDLQNRIDSIADAKANMNTGDTTYIDIATAIVGAEDYSSAWWTAFSDYLTVPANKLLHIEFVNHNGASVNSWNNWNLAIANEAENRDADNYEEYLVLRSDAYGWGNDDFDLAMITQNYPDTDGDDDIWNDFRATMDGANVTIEIDHSATGNVFITATAAGTNGTELVMTYQQAVSATSDITAFLICDASFFEVEKAFLLPSKVTAIEDVEPVSIIITETPASVEIGDIDFWSNAVATVTYTDGSSAVVDTADLSFSVIPDMTTMGEKTVSVAYSKTKQGEYCQAISTSYTLEVNNSIASIEITTLPNITEYYFFDDTLNVNFDLTGIEITATYSDGTSGILPIESLDIDPIKAIAGTQNITLAYVGSTSTVTTTCELTLTKGVGQVGASDNSTGFWGAQSADYTVASGTSKLFTLYCYSAEAQIWNNPITILRKADYTENAVVRMDNAGWGDGYPVDENMITNDWNFDTFMSNINGSKVEITVTNNGDNTATVTYDVTYNNGDTHFQKYEGITVDSADLTTALTVENCYLVFVD
ncbi:MAG: hypothetical protein PF444_07990 [Bacteroidales bacterium]|jgi:hypothetical protein|nr:hypothetical protein [Bacteroidales bacterium]